MENINEEIGAFASSEAQAHAGMVGSDLTDTWNHDTLTEFAELCREESDLLNFDVLQGLGE
jgi:hypothetical protein